MELRLEGSATNGTTPSNFLSRTICIEPMSKVPFHTDSKSRMGEEKVVIVAKNLTHVAR